MYSSPFRSDYSEDENDSEYDNSEFDRSITNLHFPDKFKEEDGVENRENNYKHDEILIIPNLDDAAKFISTLKFKKDKKMIDNENQIPLPDLQMPFDDVKLVYQKELGKLEELRQSECYESPQIDDFII